MVRALCAETEALVSNRRTAVGVLYMSLQAPYLSAEGRFDLERRFQIDCDAFERESAQLESLRAVVGALDETPQHLPQGKNVPASPDKRVAGTPTHIRL